MSGPANHAVITNRILRALPQPTLARLCHDLEPVELARGQAVGHVDQHVDHLLFINRGLISLVKTMRDGRTIEIGAIGPEGVTDPNAVFGINETVLESMVQVPGIALRIRRDTVQAVMQEDAALRTLLERYARFAFHQLAQTAACNRLHSLEERCCRWLLIAHDSAHSDTFPLTHEFLAMMLGVHRAGVSIAAHTLKKAGLISYTHGMVTIADRNGIEDVACECYRTIEAELNLLYCPRGQPVLSSS